MPTSPFTGRSVRVLGSLATVLVLSACAESTDVGGEAYPPYLDGVTMLTQGGESNLRQAIDRFSQAVAIDSGYAPAYAGLARAYAEIGGNYNIVSPEASWPMARAAADRAVSLDDGLAEAHLAQALVKEGADWDWTGAEQEFQQTLVLDPDNIAALNGYAWLLHDLGRTEQAVPYLDRANAQVPGSADPFLRYLATGDAAGPVADVTRQIEADPGNPGGYWTLALIHTWEGEYEAAAERLQQQIPLMEGDVVDEVALLGFVFGRMGREADARSMLAQLDELAAEGRYVTPVLKAWVHSGLGETDEALALLRAGFEARAHRSGLGMNAFSAVFDPIRTDPRFAELLQEMGLER